MNVHLRAHVASGALAAAVCGGLLIVLACGPSAPAASPAAEFSCSKRRPSAKIQTADGNVVESAEGKPLQTHDFVSIGDVRRDTALREVSTSTLPGAGTLDFAAATDCYHHALELSPESYEAKLGLGVTYLGRVRSLGEHAEKTSAGRAYLTAAKRSLGEAYMLRQGTFEPLFYLAEAAVLEKEYARAAQILEALRAAKARPGPVAALLGFIAERSNNRTEAQKLYAEAVEAGGPFETLVFSATWLNYHGMR